MLEINCVLDVFKTGRKSVRLRRSRISFLVHIHQLANVLVLVQERKTGKLVVQMSDTISVSAESGKLWDKVERMKGEVQDGERKED